MLTQAGEALQRSFSAGALPTSGTPGTADSREVGFHLRFKAKLFPIMTRAMKLVDCLRLRALTS